MFSFLYANKRIPIKVPEIIMEIEYSLTYIFFSVVMNLVSVGSILLNSYRFKAINV